jgi:AbrB family looped-hinge helix DNA binding protein
MAKTRLSTKGQIVLPSDIREALNWQPGTELQVERKGDVVTLRAKVGLPEKNLQARDVFGVLKWHGKPATIEDMNRAVDEMFEKDPGR